MGALVSLNAGSSLECGTGGYRGEVVGVAVTLTVDLL